MSISGCKPELYIPFNRTADDRSGNWLSVGNEFVEVDAGFGRFNGKSRLIVPRFTNFGGISTLVIKAKYTSDKMNMSAPRAVVSNSDCGNDPSILITEDDDRIHFGVRTTATNYFLSTSVPRRVRSVTSDILVTISLDTMIGAIYTTQNSIRITFSRSLFW